MTGLSDKGPDMGILEMACSLLAVFVRVYLLNGTTVIVTISSGRSYLSGDLP